MARYTGPKNKLSRREGENIFGKQSRSLDRRINVLPGSHGKRGRRKPSEYGVQLREKQKLKRMYGLMEKQFSNYIKKAAVKKVDTAEQLVRYLETRLDNVVYRLGFAVSRNQARQFVSHRLIFVNGQKVNIPSYSVREGDVISISPTLLKNEILKQRIQETTEILPFLEKENATGKLSRYPNLDEIPNPVDYQLVIEFYSR